MSAKSSARVKKNLREIKHNLTDTKEAIVHAVSGAKDKFIDVEKNLLQYAKQNPFKTIGLSVLAGIVAAHLLSIKKNK